MNQEMIDKLKAPFPANLIKWRAASRTNAKGEARVVAYAEARDIADRLTEVDTLWQSKMTGLGTWTTPDGALHTAVECSLTVGNITRSGVGEGSVLGDKGYQDAAKTAASDALKRAAVHFGVCRYLYDLPDTWAPVDTYGNVTSDPALPDWALPKGAPKRDPYKQSDKGPQHIVGNAEKQPVTLTDEAITQLKIRAKEIAGVELFTPELRDEVYKALGVSAMSEWKGDYDGAVKAIEAYYRGEESFDQEDAFKVVADLREEATKGRDPNADITDPQKQHLPGALVKLFPDTDNTDELRHNLMDAVFGKKHTGELTKGEASALFSLVYVGGRGADQYDMKPDAIVNAATVLGVYKGRKLFEDIPF